LAGLAGAASAQSLTIRFEADATRLNNPFDTVHWTMTADFTGFHDPTAYFGGFVGELWETQNGDTLISNLEINMAGQGTTPVVGPGSISSINVFNSALLGSDDPTRPFPILEFDAVARSFEGSAYMAFDAIGVASVFQNNDIFTLPALFDPADNPFVVISDSVLLIPAPGSACLLALGACSVRTRRRLPGGTR
jgi:hypothetical protein